MVCRMTFPTHLWLIAEFVNPSTLLPMWFRVPGYYYYPYYGGSQRVIAADRKGLRSGRSFQPDSYFFHNFSKKIPGSWLSSKFVSKILPSSYFLLHKIIVTAVARRVPGGSSIAPVPGLIFRTEVLIFSRILKFPSGLLAFPIFSQLESSINLSDRALYVAPHRNTHKFVIVCKNVVFKGFRIDRIVF